jgi:hypothetical protein
MRTLPIAAVLLLAGCWPGSLALPPGRPVSEAGSGPAELRVTAEVPPLRPARRIPVLAPPEVFAAFVAAHLRGDVMVGEHWVYFKLRDAEWYPERARESAPDPDGPALPESLRPLGGMDASRAVIPHR